MYMFCKQLKVESARGLRMKVVGAAGIDLSRASSGSRLRRTGPTCSGDMVVTGHITWEGNSHGVRHITPIYSHICIASYVIQWCSWVWYRFWLSAFHNYCVLSRFLPQYSGLELYKTYWTLVIFVCFSFIDGHGVGLKPRTVINGEEIRYKGCCVFREVSCWNVID